MDRANILWDVLGSEKDIDLLCLLREQSDLTFRSVRRQKSNKKDCRADK